VSAHGHRSRACVALSRTAFARLAVQGVGWRAQEDLVGCALPCQSERVAHAADCGGARRARDLVSARRGCSRAAPERSVARNWVNSVRTPEGVDCTDDRDDCQVGNRGQRNAEDLSTAASRKRGIVSMGTHIRSVRGFGWLLELIAALRQGAAPARHRRGRRSELLRGCAATRGEGTLLRRFRMRQRHWRPRESGDVAEMGQEQQNQQRWRHRGSRAVRRSLRGGGCTERVPPP
jgi:hypothetical protein